MRKNVRHQWMKSLVLIISAILIIVFLFNLYVAYLMKQEIIRNNNISKDFLMQSVDTRLDEIQNIAIDLGLNSNNRSYIIAKDPTQFSNARTYYYSELFRNAIIANDFVQSIFVYYPVFDYVIGDLGSFESQSYYHLANGLNATHYDTWISLIQNTDQRQYIVLNDEKGATQLYYRYEIPTDTKNQREKVVLMLKIRSSEIQELLSAIIKNQPNTYLGIFDDSNKFFAQVGKGRPEDLGYVLSEYSHKQNQKITSFAYEEYTYTISRSRHRNLNYLIATNNKEVLLPIKEVTVLSYSVLGICLLVGIGLSFIISIRHSKPVERLASQLVDFPNSDSTAEIAVDEYSFIESRVHQILKENKDTIERSENLGWSLRNSFINEIFFVQQEDYGYITALATHYGLSFDGVYYTLIVFSKENEKESTKENLLHTMRRYAEKSEESEGLVIPALIEDVAIFLWNYEAAGQEKVKKFAEEIAEAGFLSSTYIMSDEFTSITLLIDRYEQIRNQMLDVHIEKEPSSLRLQPSTQEAVFNNWVNKLKLREYAQAAEQCAEVFQRYVQTAPDLYVQRVRKYAVINPVLECVFYQNSITPDKSFLQQAKNQLRGAESLAILEKRTKNILLSLNQSSTDFLSQQEDSLVYQVKEVIENEFDRPYIGLYYLADSVHASTSYISRAFKEEFGVGITHYINQLRVKKAKLIMSEKDMTIKEIALEVGFTSDINFIRVFKKYERTTPGAYRDKQ